MKMQELLIRGDDVDIRGFRAVDRLLQGCRHCLGDHPRFLVKAWRSSVVFGMGKGVYVEDIGTER